MSLFTGITTQHHLAGFFGLSAYLLLGDRLESEFIPKDAPNKGVPVFMGHGEDDPLVKYAWGQKTAEVLRGLGFEVKFHGYRYVFFLVSIIFHLCRGGEGFQTSW